MEETPLLSLADGRRLPDCLLIHVHSSTLRTVLATSSSVGLIQDDRGEVDKLDPD